MDIDVVIEGLSGDLAVAIEIRQRIQSVCKQSAHSGEWSVLVSPSEARGQWGFGLRGPSGHHVASFTAPPDRLPALIAGKLGEFLERRSV